MSKKRKPEDDKSIGKKPTREQWEANQNNTKKQIQKMKNNRIGRFRKTDHFMFRQWDRKIDESSLKLILKSIKNLKPSTLYIISRKALRKLNIKSNGALFIKADNEVLITCYYGRIEDVLFISKTRENYELITKI